jgi:hypothetical protein
VHRKPLEPTVDDETEEQPQGTDAEAPHEQRPPGDVAEKPDLVQVGDDEACLAAGVTGCRLLRRRRRARTGRLLRRKRARDEHRRAKQQRQGKSEVNCMTQQRVWPSLHAMISR